MAKKAFKPFMAYQAHLHSLIPVEITSINPDDKSVWYARADGQESYYGRERGKARLTYGSHLYAKTEHNDKIAVRCAELQATIKKCEDEIDEAISRLETKIDLAYFGLKDERW
jgi:hypothetical protein